MNGNKCVADTNAFIYLLDKHPALEPLLTFEWLFSFITEIELLGKPGIGNAEIKNIKAMLNTCTKVTHADAINEIAITIKRQYRIKLPDALIAATAIKMNVPLLSFDKGFRSYQKNL